MDPLRLQTRLFLWFFVGVLCASFTSFLVFTLTRHDGDHPLHAFPRIVAGEFAREWGDPAERDAHVRRLHDETGTSFTLIVDPSTLPDNVAAPGDRALVFVHGDAYVPISKNGHVVGALTFKGDLPSKGLRPVAGILVATLFFLFAARRISRQIARPLERVVEAADKLGNGDLSARANVNSREGIEAQHLGTAFDAMAVRVERLVRDQRELLAAVSHELRSPLGRARVALEIARERDDKSAALDKLGSQLDDVDHIIGDLLTVTRVGLTDLRKRRINLGEWLNELRHAEQVSVVLHGVMNVDADPELLARVVDNLVSNARAHGHAVDRPIEIDASAIGTVARVTVRDHGDGFPEAMLTTDATAGPRAFEPFVRGDVARSPGGHGAGLGLAIVKRIVEAHGGAVGLKNHAIKPEKATRRCDGAEVWFELPLAPDKAVA